MSACYPKIVVDSVCYESSTKVSCIPQRLVWLLPLTNFCTSSRKDVHLLDF